MFWSHSLLLVDHPHPLLGLLEDVVLPGPGALQLVAARLPPDALATLLRDDFGIRIRFCIVISNKYSVVRINGVEGFVEKFAHATHVQFYLDRNVVNA